MKERRVRTYHQPWAFAWASLACLALLVGWTGQVEASHYRGGNIYYENLGPLGGTSPQATWIIIKATLEISQRRSFHCGSAVPASQGATGNNTLSCCTFSTTDPTPCIGRWRNVGGTFTWGAGGMPHPTLSVSTPAYEQPTGQNNNAFATTYMEVIDENTSADYLDFRLVLYRIYPPTTLTTTIKWGSCCWISGVQGASSSFEVNTVAQVASGNRDPVFNSPLYIVGCGNFPLSYDLNPADPDKDDFEVILTPTTNGADTRTPPLTVSKSGVITWATPIAGLWVVKVTVYDLIKGTTVRKGASTFRDVLLQVQATCSNKEPVITFTSPDSVTVRPGQQACVDVVVTDPDGDKITVRVTPAKPGATVTPATALNPNQNSPVTFKYCWTPALTDEGTTHNIQFTATDNGLPNLSGQKSFAITVSRGGPPTVTVAPTGTNKDVDEGQTLVFTLTASDADTSIDTFDVKKLPAFCTSRKISATQIEITCKPGFQDGDDPSGSKTYDVEVEAKDKDGIPKTTTLTVKVKVNNVNRPPTISGTPPTTAIPEILYTYTVQASDPDGGALTYKKLKGPGTINANTGKIDWTPTPADAGKTFDFEVEVCDSGTPPLCVKQTWQVVVGKQNAPPQIVGIPPTNLQSGQSLAYSPAVRDRDLPNDTHTWKLVKGPTGATIDPATGKVAWTPGAADAGKDFDFEVQVCDKGGLCATQIWKIRVTSGNNPPLIVGTPPNTANNGSLYNYKPKVQDADPGDTHTWKLDKGPSTASIDPNTGELFWKPKPEDVGKIIEFSITVCDKGTPPLCATQTWKVKVTDTNDPPAISGTPGTSGTVGTNYTYGPKVVDANTNDTHTWSLPKAPLGATIDPKTGKIDWTPQSGANNAEHEFEVRVCDNKGACATQTWKVRVGQGNNPPVIDGTPLVSGEEGKVYTYAPKVNDADTGDTHTWSLASGPAGATVDPATGKLEWTPPPGSAGKSFEFEVQVCDNKGSCAKQKWSVKVLDNGQGNTPPAITSTPGAKATSGKEYVYDTKIFDPDTGDTHTYTLETGPTGAKVDPATGKLTWTPGAADVGKSIPLSVKVCDKAGDCATQTWSVKVEAGNHPPQINGAPGNFASPTKDYTANPTVVDPDTEDQGKHKWAIKNGPPGATIDPATGAIKWRPAASDVGKIVEFEIEVCDPSGACANRKWQILVTNGDINNPPVITSTPGTQATPERIYSYSPTAVDPDLGDTLSWKLKTAPAGATIDPVTGKINWTPGASDSGKSAAFEVEVCDDKGACVTQKWSVSVGQGNQAPVITSTPPSEAYVNEKLTYNATVSDADAGDTHTWTLLKGPAGASIDPATGELTWTPAAADALKDHEFEVQVCDSAVPKSCTVQKFTVKAYDRCKVDSQCPQDQICAEGKCFAPGCSDQTPKCPKQGDFCKDSACIPNKCDPNPCASDEVCRPSDGKCIKPCAGVTCQTGEFCKDGKCETDPCATASSTGGPCAVDEICDTSDPQKPTCIADPCKTGSCKHGRVCTEGKCIDDPCPGMQCPKPEHRCLAGQCIDRKPCQVDVDCDGKDVCLGGRCYPPGCYDATNACTAPELCLSANCKKDPCDGKTCGAGEFCRRNDGKCIKPCAGVACKAGEKCVDGACVADPCDSISCPAGEVCVPDDTGKGACEKERCNASGVCKAGRVCSPNTNECLDDPCANVTCPDGKQVCDSGQCVNPPQCKFDKDCPGEQLCVKGKCINPTCKKNEDCPEDSLCFDGSCAKDPCKDVQCAADESCKAGKCVKSCAGVFCPTGEKCIEGTCTQDPCADKQCAADEVCVNGTCTKNPCEGDSCRQGRICLPEGRCAEDPCKGVKCPNGETCKEAQCTGERKCKLDIDCPGDAICVNGTCQPKGCYDGTACATAELCLAGKCGKNACEGKTCAADETCRPADGQCVKDCPTCDTGKRCVNGACVDDPCGNVTCADNELCVEGKCVADACKTPGGKPCKYTRVCAKDQCIDDPCTGVQCAEDETCREGVCYGKKVTPQENVEETPSNEITVTEATPEPATEVTTGDGGNNEQPQIEYSVSGGCGCHQNGQGPLSSLAFLLLLLGLGFVITRKRHSA